MMDEQLAALYEGSVARLAASGRSVRLELEKVRTLMCVYVYVYRASGCGCGCGCDTHGGTMSLSRSVLSDPHITPHPFRLLKPLRLSPPPNLLIKYPPLQNKHTRLSL